MEYSTPTTSSKCWPRASPMRVFRLKLDAELREVLGAWPALSQSTEAKIISIVKAATCSTRCHSPTGIQAHPANPKRSRHQ